ncbi:hypothetical protein LDENG_00248230 [Lucifuga dentata]|nr:hypothetical protein LDENG_00248230 [Lucifuga dentata]
MLSIHEAVRLSDPLHFVFNIPKSRTKTFGAAAFSRYGNSLPEDLRGAENIDIFKRKRKNLSVQLGFHVVFYDFIF